MTASVVADTGAALISAGSSLAGALRADIALAHTEPVIAATDMYAPAYVVRAAPLGSATAVALPAYARAVAWPMPVVAASAQVGNSAIGARQRNPGITLGAGVVAVLHLASAWRLAR